jgi:hypothetical protein
MVTESVLRNLNAALQAAGEKRNLLQMRVNDLRTGMQSAKANFQRAETQEANTRQFHEQKHRECKELLDYYNGIADKTDLAAIPARIERLTAEANDALTTVRRAGEIRQQQYREMEIANSAFAGAEIELKQAQQEWAGISARVHQAHEER